MSPATATTTPAAYQPVWPVVYPEGKAARVHSDMKAVKYLINHQIESGMSFGVFDLEYEYKRSKSKATEGKLYRDDKDEDSDAHKFLRQMDFPLVSVALAYDQIKPLDMEKLAPLIAVLPLCATIYHVLEQRDPRSPESWGAKETRQVLMRNATSTRADYECAGIMK